MWGRWEIGDALKLHVMPLGNVGYYKQNRNANFIIMHPVEPFSNLVIHLFVRISDLLEGCCMSCLIGSQPFHLRPHLVRPAKPFVCIHLHDVLLFWSVPPYIIFPPDLSCPVQLFVLSLHSYFCLPASLVCTGASAVAIASLCLIIN